MSFRTALAYRPDGADYFDSLAQLPWAMFLDSGPPEARLGRYDIIAWQPAQTLHFDSGTAIIQDANGGQTSLQSRDPLGILQQLLDQRPQIPEAPAPFASGAIGYIGYDIGRYYEKLPDRLPQQGPLPELAMGLYDHALILDHHQQQAWIHSNQPITRDLARQLHQPPATPNQPLRPTSAWRTNPDDPGYAAAFQRIAHYIRCGDCYQVNLARHFSVDTTGDPWLGYRALRRLNPAPHAAYLNLPQGQILSCSPERFLSLNQNRVETCPIKGTRPRHPDPQQDQANRQQLQSSPKDRAENLMIVDLLRNDLGRCCLIGSVKVPKLFEIQSFRQVHHLVSTIQGQLPPDQQATDLLRHCFPGGSITGAPKIRAMEIIEELETKRRGVYCGSIGYITDNGDMDTNIAIRTLTHHHGQIQLHAGGGLVADSDLHEEMGEIKDKARAFLDFLRL
jgi:para-aminobenzoate synthetase component 1